jgi:proteasome lid subunit RPN8/RPN11
MPSETDAVSRLTLLPRHRLAIERHGAATYPEECCGVLIGRSREDGVGATVERLLSVDNERQDSRGNRFLIHPETVLAAEREARRAGLTIVGYYHSHPDHPAEPSEFDREHAWPGLSYVIVSVRQGEPDEMRSWRLTDDRERFEEETLTAEPPIPAGARRAAEENR